MCESRTFPLKTNNPYLNALQLPEFGNKIETIFASFDLPEHFFLAILNLFLI